MAKTAVRYLDVDPWKIVETDFHPERSLVSESMFSVGNEYMGTRGFFEEGYSGDSMIGTYFNGLFERFTIDHPSPHRGLATEDQKIANAVNWLYTRIRFDGETLDLATSTYSDFVRTLDMRTGLLRREFTWTTAKNKKKIRLVFERFTSMADAPVGAQRITLQPIGCSGTVRIESGLDFDVLQYLKDKKLWQIEKTDHPGGRLAILGRLPRSGHMVASVARVQAEGATSRKDVNRDKYVGTAVSLKLKDGQPTVLEKIAVNATCRDEKSTPTDFYKRAVALADKLGDTTFDNAFEKHAAYWQDVWSKLDVQIEGDPLNQQGIRFCIFNQHQTYHGVDPTLNVGAKGLTGEVYDGKAWWDTETYCLWFYMFNNPQAARNLLMYRYNTLEEAKKRAPEVDGARGARYPMATIDGKETIATWQHGDLEIHVSAAVAYGIWHYTKVIGDTSLLYDYGIEILIEVCRYYASRGSTSQTGGDYGFWNVMGADEFHMQCHNNAYTNVMAKKCFLWTLDFLKQMEREVPDKLKAVLSKTGLTDGERKDWRTKARAMRTQYDPETEMIEQHDGFFDLPHLDLESLSPDELPLYDYWPYLKIFRFDMIKQPDVLLLPLFFSSEYSQRCKKVNYEYYEPRCSHESSLSPAIHSILASELGKHEQAYTYFQHATRLDLDDYNRNTCAGLHTTSMSGAWMNIVLGFGGLRTDGKRLSLNPSIPAAWTSFTFRILYHGSVLEVTVGKEQLTLTVTQGDPLKLTLFGKDVTAKPSGLTVPMPGDRVAK